MSKQKKLRIPRNTLVLSMLLRHGKGTKYFKDRRLKRRNRNSWKTDEDLS